MGPSPDSFCETGLRTVWIDARHGEHNDIHLGRLRGRGPYRHAGKATDRGRTMKFSTNEDIGVPIETVFAAVSDFDGFQRQARRRGVEVTRLDAGPGIEVGASWQIRFAYRGKPRQVTAEIAEWSPATGYRVTFAGGGIAGDMPVELVALSRQRTRLSLEIEMRPKTLAARVVIQSLRLAKASLSRKFKKRVAEFAAELERRNAA